MPDYLDVQRRAAGDGGAAGVGPQHLHVVPLPVRDAVPRVGGLRAGGRPVARRARLRRRRRRAPLRAHLPARLRGGRGVPGRERGGVRRVDGHVAGGVVAQRARGRAGAPRRGPAARPQARAARRRALPRRGAPALRHDRGGGAGSAQQRLRDRRVRCHRHHTADSSVRDGAAAGAAARGGAPRGAGALRLRLRLRQARLRRRQRQRRARRAARLAQEGQPPHVHHTR
ncbi:translation initiation factor IF-2-like isoform X2 [Vanessa cardui]|uniref:translation initiation factor IF-2-like isoform X2 n=1 Tax=Vanessa cardui TaxID=171605 RepID=UPI001F13ABDA|nr:translation initiation factor IF-2-like isoform X2 [Vanessa cardui]